MHILPFNQIHSPLQQKQEQIPLTLMTFLALLMMMTILQRQLRIPTCTAKHRYHHHQVEQVKTSEYTYTCITIFVSHSIIDRHTLSSNNQLKLTHSNVHTDEVSMMQSKIQILLPPNQASSVTRINHMTKIILHDLQMLCMVAALII